MKYTLRTFVLTALVFLLCSCTQKPIVGWWRATDSTVFHFRADGTFVGRDYVGKPMWGNWVDLGHDKFGFQSLQHMESYEPQYAVVTSPDRMQYVGTVGVIFIYTWRIPEEQGQKEIDPVMAAIPTRNQPVKR